ncbi:MAG: hypothetical protein U1E48_10645 [Paracoccaceae bacterium]
MDQLKEARVLTRDLEHNAATVALLAGPQLASALGAGGKFGDYFGRLNLCAVEDAKCDRARLVREEKEMHADLLNECRKNYLGEN